MIWSEHLCVCSDSDFSYLY